MICLLDTRLSRAVHKSERSSKARKNRQVAHSERKKQVRITIEKRKSKSSRLERYNTRRNDVACYTCGHDKHAKCTCSLEWVPDTDDLIADMLNDQDFDTWRQDMAVVDSRYESDSYDDKYDDIVDFSDDWW